MVTASAQAPSGTSGGGGCAALWMRIGTTTPSHSCHSAGVTGFLYEPGDVDKAAELIQQLAADAQLRWAPARCGAGFSSVRWPLRCPGCLAGCSAGCRAAPRFQPHRMAWSQRVAQLPYSCRVLCLPSFSVGTVGIRG